MRQTLLTVLCLGLAACGGKSAETQAKGDGDERAALAARSNLEQPVNHPELLACTEAEAMTPYCGYQNPEDLVSVPGTAFLIVSEMGEFMADAPGALARLDRVTGEKLPLAIEWTTDGVRWGEADCPAPDPQAFSPHGIDLTTRDDGALALLVVNHGKRESVEFFEVLAPDTLRWRGCALPPEDPFINDVAARSDGGFYVTHMWNKSGSFEEIAATLTAGQPTGWVWAWTPEDGFERLPNSSDLMPNGIALNQAEDRLYVNVYMGDRTFVLDLATAERIGEVSVRQPDNVTVDDDGVLWIASHQHDPLGQTCAAVTEGPCLLPFQVLKVDPLSLEAEVVLDHNGAPMGYSTVALNVDGTLYLGTAHGDRIVSVPLE